MTLKPPFHRITIEPDKMGGQPCIRGLRPTVKRVLEILAAYSDRTELFADYPDLQEADLQQALAFAAAHLDDRIEISSPSNPRSSRSPSAAPSPNPPHPLQTRRRPAALNFGACLVSAVASPANRPLLLAGAKDIYLSSVANRTNHGLNGVHRTWALAADASFHRARQSTSQDR